MYAAHPTIDEVNSELLIRGHHFKQWYTDLIEELEDNEHWMALVVPLYIPLFYCIVFVFHDIYSYTGLPIIRDFSNH